MTAPPDADLKDGALAELPGRLRPHYRAFLASGRILLTGHSHQAWPDIAEAGMRAAFRDAAALADDKWKPALEVADGLREVIAQRIGADAAEIALGQNTHELCTRFLSALDLRSRPHLITTSGEFHSLDRQLRRLAEAGVEVTFVPADPVATLAARIAAGIRPNTAAVMASSVLFETSTIVPGLGEAVRAAHRVGAEVLIDAYHAFDVVPFRVEDFGPDPVFVVAGGYKYAQWGEGNCFLRVPPSCALRPMFTGWFSDFANLAEGRRDGRLGYGARPADRFAGSTYDPTSHYRALAVARFFDEQGLSVAVLRRLSLRQTDRIIAALSHLDIATPRAADARGGFVAVRVPKAQDVVTALRERSVLCDARGDMLRFGPAPYVTDAELDGALAATLEVLSSIPGS